MAEEIVGAEEGVRSKRKIIIIGGIVFLAVLLLIGIIFSVLFYTGVLATNEDLEARLASLEGSGQTNNSITNTSSDDSSLPQLLEVPGSTRLDTLYHQFGQTFTVNVLNSRKVMQLGLTISTHYDQQVIDNIVKHELAVRSAILEHLSFITEDETLEEDFRQRVGEELAVVINAELEFVEGFGGVERVLFTEFLVQ